MKLDLKNLTGEQLAEFKRRAFDAEIEIGDNWWSQLYGIQGNEGYVSHFLEQALSELNVVTATYSPNDWWRCACISVEYFRKKFEVTLPIKIARGDTSGNSYAWNVDDDFEVDASEIVLGTFPGCLNGIPPVEVLIAMIAHEVWHAHQVEKYCGFLKSTQGILNLDEIDPDDVKNRGAIYVLGNYVLYEEPVPGDFVAYSMQIVEAEAYYIQGQIISTLSQKSIHH